MTSPNETLDETTRGTDVPFPPAALEAQLLTRPPAARSLAMRQRWLLPIFAVLIAGLVGGAIVALRANSPTAADVGASFCGDLTSQNYRAAYDLLSVNLRSQITSEQFAQGARALDASEGKVLRCAQDQIRTRASATAGANAETPTFALMRQKLGRQSGTIRLINERSVWKVDALDARLFALDPLLASLRFGRDVGSANYVDSFSLISNKLRTGTNLIGWQSVLDGTWNGVKWLRLNPDATTYQATSTGATVRALATVEQVSTGQRKTVTITLTLAPQGADWRIDNIQLDGSAPK